MEKLAALSLAQFGQPLTAGQVEALAHYEALLLEWNARFNLTAIRTAEEIRIRHFLDSLSCLALDPAPEGQVIDVGSGAGFPGLVLKIARPAIRLTLVESVAKKAEFCRLVAAELGLENVDVLTERAENLGQNPVYRERSDWAVARAVAAMPVLAEYLLPLVKVGGRMLAQKGHGGLAEAESAAQALRTLGGRLAGSREIRLPGVPNPHLLIAVEKVQPTPPQYPRRVGVPVKRPL